MSLLTLADAVISPAPTAPVSTHSGMSAGWLIVVIILIVLAVAGLWRTFQKANRPGWAAIIPIYNVYNIIKIAGRPGWWVILYFIPIVNIVVNIVVSIDVAKAFGKSTAFGVIGLWLFSFIGYLMLGFGDATYNGSGSAPATPVTTPTPAAPTV